MRIVFLVVSLMLVFWYQISESSPAVGVVGGVVNMNMTITDRDINNNRDLKDPNDVIILDFFPGQANPSYTSPDVKYTGNISNGFVSFTLSNLTTKSAGIFQYVIHKGIIGNVIAGEQFLVIAESPSTPVINELSLQAVAGREYRLNCSAVSRSEKPGHNLTMFSEWKRNGVNIMSDTKYGVDGTILTIRNLSRIDYNVRLTCIAFEDQRMKSTESIAFPLNIYYGPDNIQITPSGELTVDEGRLLNLTCSGECNLPCSSYQWYKDSPLTLLGSSQTLAITNISQNNTGVYTCIVNNTYIPKIGTAQITVKVNYGPDQITLSPSQRAHELAENSSLNVNCSADCVPSCQYRWTGPGGNYPDKTGILSISRITRNQTGDFTCTASNPIITSNSATATVKVIVQYGPDSLTLSPSQMSYELAENSSLNVNCSADCVPGCQYIWTGPGGNYLDKTGILTISKITRNQTGNFTCTALNPNISNSATTTVKVTVQYGPDNVTLSPSQMSYELAEHSSLNVNCSADCVPGCHYRWTGPGGNYPDKTGILSISRITRNQTGNFTCTALNPNITSNSATTTVKITVQYGPDSITLSPSQMSYELAENSSLNVNCSADCVPGCQYIWTGPGGKYLDKTGILTISKITRNQTGNFACTALNPNISNSATTTVKVTVQYGPDTPLILIPANISYRLVEGAVILNINCSSDCVPPCHFNWTGPVMSSTGVISLGTLNRSESGSFKCRGENHKTQQHADSNEVRIIVIYGPDSPVLTPDNTVYTVNESNAIPNIKCSADCFPSCTSRWYKEQKVVYGNPADILSLGNVYRNATGTYRCQSENMESKVTAEKSIQLVVQYPPVVRIDSHNGTYNDTDIVLTCSAHGIPEQYVFTLTHSSLFTGIKIRHPNFDSVSTGVIRYRFSNIMDTGNYTCTVNNGIADYIDGSVNKSASETVFIKGPPNVTSSNKIFYAEKGQSGILAIEFYNSLLDPNVTWYRNRNQSLENLDSSDKYNISISNTSVTLNFYSVSIQQPGFSTALEIRNVTPDDFGSYQVNVQNSVGVMSPRELVLRPRGAPDVPHDVHIVPSSITTSSVGVEWLSGFYGGFDQTFAIEYREHTDTNWTKSSEEVFGGMTQDKYFNITVGGLHQQTMYLFRMYAWNSYNRSEYSVVINATTTADNKGEQMIGNGSDKVIIGSAVGAVVLIGFAVVVGVVIIKRRRMEKLNADGLVNNPVYDSTDPPTGFINNSSATGDEYAAVKKKSNQKEDLSSLYAQVDKTNKMGKKGTAKEKHQKSSKGEIYENVDLVGKSSDPENLYENSQNAKSRATVDNVYENPETAAHNGPQVNRDGLLYADLMLNPPTTRNGKPVIFGIENRTEYADIAYNKRGEPLPDSDDEKISDGAKKIDQ